MPTRYGPIPTWYGPIPTRYGPDTDPIRAHTDPIRTDTDPIRTDTTRKRFFTKIPRWGVESYMKILKSYLSKSCRSVVFVFFTFWNTVRRDEGGAINSNARGQMVVRDIEERKVHIDILSLDPPRFRCDGSNIEAARAAGRPWMLFE